MKVQRTRCGPVGVVRGAHTCTGPRHASTGYCADTICADATGPTRSTLKQGCGGCRFRSEFSRTEQNNRPGRGASRHSSPRSRLVVVAPARRARVQLCRPSRACRPASRLVSLYPIHDRTDAARTCVTREAPKPRTPEYVGVRASGALHPGLAAAVPPPPAHEQRQRTAPSTGRMLEPSIASSVASAPSSGHERSSLLTDCEQDAGSKL